MILAFTLRGLALGTIYGTFIGVTAWALLAGIARLIPQDDPWAGREGEE